MKKQTPLAAISENVGDALSAGSGFVQDLGSTAVHKASDVASEIPETVSRLAQRAERRIRPPKRRSPSWSPWTIAGIVALVVCIALIVWRRRSPGPVDEYGALPPEEYTERAAAAAVGR
jgi:hypothetical protein